MSVLLDSNEVTKTVRRLSHEVIENYVDLSKLVLVGIVTRGEYLSNRIAQQIETIESNKVESGYLDVTLYRDDLDSRGSLKSARTSKVSNIDSKDVLLIDDVLYEGRTIRAALDALKDFGRPKSVKLLVLIDRQSKKLPIAADFVGKSIKTKDSETVKVYLTEIDNKDSIEIVKNND